MKKHFNKELVIIKKDNEDFKNSPNCWICDNEYIDGDVKVRNDCHVTGKYRCSAYRDCNIKVKLNYKIPVEFHNLKNYDCYLIMQELGKFDFKINVIPNGLEKYTTFSINRKFKYLSQEFDTDVLDLVEQKGFYPYEYICCFENFRGRLPTKEKFYSLLTDKKLSYKEHDQVAKLWNTFKMKTMKDYLDLHLKSQRQM